MADPQPGRSNEFTPGDEHDRWAREEWDRIWSRGFGGKQKREAGRATRKLLADLRRRATSPEDAKLRDALIVARQQLVTLGGEHSLYDPDGDRIQAAVLTQIDMALNGDLDDARDRVSAALSHGEDL